VPGGRHGSWLTIDLWAIVVLHVGPTVLSNAALPARLAFSALNRPRGSAYSAMVGLRMSCDRGATGKRPTDASTGTLESRGAVPLKGGGPVSCSSYQDFEGRLV
jgi:hypothetical protein